MLYADLHIHSNYSDGKLSPEEIVQLSIQKGIKCISITDHDNVSAQYIIDSFKEQNSINIIPGLELSSQYNDIEIHILGYFIDIENKNLKQKLEDIRNLRQERARDIIIKLKKLNINVNYEEIYDNDYDRSIGRLHIAKLLVEKGAADSIKEAFMKYLMRGRPAFVERCKINYKDALKLITDAKGIPVLAHPGEIYRDMIIETIIKDLKVYGLKGIEVFHPSHSIKSINNYYNLSKKYSLHITGGSDCHGYMINGDYSLGNVGLNETLTYKFLKSSMY